MPAALKHCRCSRRRASRPRFWIGSKSSSVDRDQLTEHLKFAAELGVAGVSRDRAWRTRSGDALVLRQAQDEQNADPPLVSAQAQAGRNTEPPLVSAQARAGRNTEPLLALSSSPLDSA